MVADLLKKVNAWCSDNYSDLFIAGIIFFTGLSGFGLGRLSIDLKENRQLFVEEPVDQSSQKTNFSSSSDVGDKQVVASRNGTTYYYSWCSGVKRIKEENKIWFQTKEQAEKAGLKLAGNCSQK